MCWNTYFYSVFWTSTNVCPKMPPPQKKTITFHNAQNKNWCLRNGLLGKMETLHTNEVMKKQKWIQTDLKDKPNRKETKIVHEKKPLKCNILIFQETQAKETRQQKSRKKRERITKKKTRNKKQEREMERECEKEKWKKPRRKKGRHWEMNQNSPFCRGKNSVFVERQKKNQKKGVKANCPKNTCAMRRCPQSHKRMRTEETNT